MHRSVETVEEQKYEQEIPALPIEKKVEKQKKPTPKFDFRLLAIGGIVVLVLIAFLYGIYYFTRRGSGSTIISPRDGMKLLYVPPGNFLMDQIN